MLGAVVALEGLAGVAAVARMLRTRGGAPLDGGAAPAGSVAVVVPVLDEERRVGAALEALAACGPEIAEIVVVDGGSTDGTAGVVAAAAARDRRVRRLDAGAPPDGWNGKAWNLEVGLRATASPWIATVDADVRVGPGTLAAAVARAERDGLAALSVATRQELADPLAALLHPALLATLVYRFGLPNAASDVPTRVQANGQLFVARREALVAADAIRSARASRCEDVTIARALAARGGRVGFFEGAATVRMHDSWRDCAANWPRSLTLHDRFVPPLATAAALAGLVFAQALPLPTLVAARRRPAARAVALALVAVRLGVLAGTRRAYVAPPPAYWLSPLADPWAVALLVASALRRRHTWRGRVLVEDVP